MRDAILKTFPQAEEIQSESRVKRWQSCFYIVSKYFFGIVGMSIIAGYQQKNHVYKY